MYFSILNNNNNHHHHYISKAPHHKVVTSEVLSKRTCLFCCLIQNPAFFILQFNDIGYKNDLQPKVTKLQTQVGQVMCRIGCMGSGSIV